MGNRIKILRKTLGLTQEEFGRKLGVSKNVIYNIEKEKIEIKDVLINHICEVYNANKCWIETGEGSMLSEVQDDVKFAELSAKILKNDDEFMKKVLFTFYSLTDEQRETVIEIAKGLVKDIKE